KGLEVCVMSGLYLTTVECPDRLQGSELLIRRQGIEVEMIGVSPLAALLGEDVGRPAASGREPQRKGIRIREGGRPQCGRDGIRADIQVGDLYLGHRDVDAVRGGDSGGLAGEGDFDLRRTRRAGE